MASDPVQIIATLAAIIGLGFFGYLLFERTRFTDVLILIAFGVLIGPVLGLFDVAGFKAASPFIGALALVIIMFDGGLGLPLKDLLSGIGKSAALAVVGFAGTVAAIAVIGHTVIGLDWLRAVLLGTILGGTSGVIIMPIIRRTTAHPTTRVLLSVESALTDVLSVIAAVTLISVILNFEGGVATPDATREVSTALKNVAAQFSVAVVLGLAAGITWIKALGILQGKRNSYMITLAAVLLLYAGAEAIGGNGAIAVLIFGIILGNGFTIAHKFQMDAVEFSDQQRQFQGEIAFLVRAFFFVYLGVILDVDLLRDPALLMPAGLMLAAALAARAVTVFVTARGDPELAADRGLMTLMLPRGLAAAVLAGLPLQRGIAGTETFVAYAFIIIAATNLVSTGAVVGYELKKKRMGDQKPPTKAAPAAPTPAEVAGTDE